MQPFNYNFCVPAKDKADADEKMKALAILSTKLSTKELAKLAHIVVNDPVRTAMAKTYLGV